MEVYYLEISKLVYLGMGEDLTGKRHFKKRDEAIR